MPLARNSHLAVPGLLPFGASVATIKARRFRGPGQHGCSHALDSVELCRAFGVDPLMLSCWTCLFHVVGRDLRAKVNKLSCLHMTRGVNERREDALKGAARRFRRPRLRSGQFRFLCCTAEETRTGSATSRERWGCAIMLFESLTYVSGPVLALISASPSSDVTLVLINLWPHT